MYSQRLSKVNQNNSLALNSCLTSQEVKQLQSTNTQEVVSKTPSSLQNKRQFTQNILTASLTSLAFGFQNTSLAEVPVFTPGKQATPALRSGIINPDSVYQFKLPEGFKIKKLSNVQTGQFCMPNCAEPWVEFIYENPKQGKLELQATPLQKIVPKPDTPITEINVPEQYILTIGSQITGTYMDEESVVKAETKIQDGRPYYFYELNALGASGGNHILVSACTKGPVAYSFKVQASEKQWGNQDIQNLLREVVESFRA